MSAAVTPGAIGAAGAGCLLAAQIAAGTRVAERPLGGTMTMTMQPTDRGDADRAGDEDAERRHVVKQRALELKRALLESTWRLSPERAASAYKEAARKARSAKRWRGSLLGLCVAVLSGAFTMLVPVHSTCSLHGELTAAEPSQLVAARGSSPARRALVHAHPSQCAQLRVDQPSVVFVDHAAAEHVRWEGWITWLAPRAGSGEAACQIELQLLSKPGDSRALAELPPAATLTAVLAVQPSNWLAVALDKLTRHDSFEQAVSVLRALGESAGRRSVVLIEHLRNSGSARQHMETLRQIFVLEEQ